MLSVKHQVPFFFILWCDSTWDWTQVSQAIGEHSNHHANVRQKTKKKHALKNYTQPYTREDIQQHW